MPWEENINKNTLCHSTRKSSAECDKLATAERIRSGTRGRLEGPRKKKKLAGIEWGGQPGRERTGSGPDQYCLQA